MVLQVWITILKLFYLFSNVSKELKNCYDYWMKMASENRFTINKMMIKPIWHGGGATLAQLDVKSNLPPAYTVPESTKRFHVPALEQKHEPFLRVNKLVQCKVNLYAIKRHCIGNKDPLTYPLLTKTSWKLRKFKA